MLSIRRATVGDFSSIARVAKVTWADTYISTPREVQARLIEHFYSPGSLRRAMDKPGALFFVACADGVVVGFAMFVELEPGAAELTRLYVLPSFQRKGIGRALLASGQQAFSRCTQTIKVAVQSDNQRACCFYEAQGFHPCGDSVVPAAGYLFRLVIYERVIDEGRLP